MHEPTRKNNVIAKSKKLNQRNGNVKKKKFVS
jgi:hypothetical protein